MKIINKIFQVLMDILIGIAIYFGLREFAPLLSENLIILFALTTTAIFAEFVEIQIKK